MEEVCKRKSSVLTVGWLILFGLCTALGGAFLARGLDYYDRSWVRVDIIQPKTGNKLESTLRYRKIAGDAMVFDGILKGCINEAGTVFSLPYGYRPSRTIEFNALGVQNGHYGLVPVTITGSGDVKISRVINGVDLNIRHSIKENNGKPIKEKSIAQFDKNIPCFQVDKENQVFQVSLSGAVIALRQASGILEWIR